MPPARVEDRPLYPDDQFTIFGHAVLVPPSIRGASVQRTGLRRPTSAFLLEKFSV